LVFDVLVEHVPVVEDTIFEEKSFDEILGILSLKTLYMPLSLWMPVVDDISFEDTIPVGAIFL
jgi:hypothetical protein